MFEAMPDADIVKWMAGELDSITKRWVEELK